MAFKDHFSSHARAYAAFRPAWPETLVDALADAGGTNHVWDVGCGSGQLSTLLTRRFSRVTATDASAEQIAQARPAERVSYLVASAERSTLPAASVDCIVVAQAAHWFDMPAFCAEAARVARPQSLVALATYGLLFVKPELDALINTFALETLANFWPPERGHVDTGYRDLHFPFEPVTLPSLEMRARWNRHQLLGYVHTWSALVAAQRAGAQPRIDAFVQQLDAAWPDAELALEVRWPLTVRAGRVPMSTHR